MVIMVNKYVLTYAGFPFPIALTLSHMAFCSTLAFIIIKAGFVDTVHMDSSTYLRCGPVLGVLGAAVDSVPFFTDSGMQECRADCSALFGDPVARQCRISVSLSGLHTNAQGIQLCSLTTVILYLTQSTLTCIGNDACNGLPCRSAIGHRKILCPLCSKHGCGGSRRCGGILR